jgi:hypothetical protein
LSFALFLSGLSCFLQGLSGMYGLGVYALI